MKYEYLSKIADFMDEWTGWGVTIYLQDGTVLSGILSGREETHYFMNDQWEEAILYAGGMYKVSVTRWGREYELSEMFSKKDSPAYLTGHPVWTYFREGGSYYFNELNEPERIVLEDGREIWNLKENWCLRRYIGHEMVEPFKEKIR